MRGRKKILGCVCCAILIWMNVIAGLFPVAIAHADQTAHNAATTAVETVHHEHAHAGSAGLHDQGAVQEASRHHPNNDSECVATCLDRISDKLVPKISDPEPRLDRNAIVIDTPRIQTTCADGCQIKLAYWPAGPPNFGRLTKNGTERLVALNARLRI